MPQAGQKANHDSLTESIQHDPISSLPFVQYPGKYWVVEATGDYYADNQRGVEYAHAAISAMSQVRFTPLLGWIIADMIKSGDCNGVVIGFMQAISEIATADSRKAVLQ